MKTVFFEKHISFIDMDDKSINVTIGGERCSFAYDWIEGLYHLNVWVICEDRKVKHISKYFIE